MSIHFNSTNSVDIEHHEVINVINSNDPEAKNM